MIGTRAFFSFTHLPEVSAHRAYNEWHQLDHRPENLLLPGVAWGERWVRSPDCAAVGSAPDPEMALLHYLNMYWFREPAERSIRAWSDLAERSWQWGRRADVHLCRRLLMEHVRPVKGYVNERVAVSVDALPLRPTRGIHVTVTQVDEPRSASAERLFGWYDRVRIPELLRCAGAAGAWTFVSDGVFARHADLSADPAPGCRRITVVFLDGDPLEFSADLARRETDLRPFDEPGAERLLLSGPLRTITPWEWEWFDEGDD